ncbi:MAG: response regulator [Candidatus Cloacimonetes bacterium]|nr:response regulator [Candidatus Cloacimonadota bacterium]
MSEITILIVEDNEFVGLDIKHRLSEIGFNVLKIAESEDDAFSFLEKTQPDIILMDIILSGKLDGIQIAGIVKKDYDIPIIFITGASDEKTIQRAKLIEPFGYLIKPFKDRELQIAIEMALYKHKLEVERNELLKKLKEQQEKIKDLSGLIPICSNCKKIRDDSGYWLQVEEYIRQHSSAEFTHSLCPICLKKLYPGLDDD